MRNIVYDLFTGMVKDYDRDPLPAEKSIVIPYPILLLKAIQESTGSMIQKVNEQGELLYKKNIVADEFGVETYTETTEGEDHEPIMVEEIVSRTYTLEQNPYIFTADEVSDAIANTIPVKSVEQLTVERVAMAEDAINAFMTMM